ncbi:uncharacterized protein LOC123498425 [Portunus trituberculatus]|uniref:uncharacterized protein LOC123498425 n=1 Tax=Portunus trituberculatus TaxID=210409 RepID=UPI001E1D1668|nr:uncharacterized protein LOC123498425 [Portunus trituberculatus]
MLRRARQCVYWPGLEGDLQHYRASCTSCETHAPSQPSETLVITPPPEYPFQSTVADMFQHEGHTYMVYADRLTGWLELAHFPHAQYPQSNGRAEAAVKTAKRIIRANTGSGGSLDTDKTSLAVLQYLNTPLRSVNKSPAQLATGRQLRDGVPTARRHYKVDRHGKDAA